jgi:hypothetical protein
LEELYYNANKDIAKEELARLVLMEIPKYEIKEKRIREILRQYGLPEERIGRWGNDYFIKE